MCDKSIDCIKAFHMREKKSFLSIAQKCILTKANASLCYSKDGIEKGPKKEKDRLLKL